MSTGTKNTEALKQLLGGKEVQGVDALTEALKEINEERAEDKKKKCKDLLRKALELQASMDQAEREFLGAKRKFDKELGKVLKRIKGMGEGKTAEQLDAEEKEAESGGESSGE